MKSKTHRHINNEMYVCCKINIRLKLNNSITLVTFSKISCKVCVNRCYSIQVFLYIFKTEKQKQDPSEIKKAMS